MSSEKLLPALQERGCIHDASHQSELEALLEKEKIAFYCGFDPTADSLHAGSMLPLIVMRRLQERGHTPVVVLGSATGMIGDPSGKSEERKLLDDETLRKNVAGIERQIRMFLSADGPNAFRIVKNDEWLGSLRTIEFLRDVGKHFSVNAMMTKDSVRARLESREQGISYTEFSYMLLQAYDFYWLNKHHNVRLQVGGSDQWGNITAGLDLIRRKNDEKHLPAYGMTFPLLTTSSGAKFGKTEKGAVWLDAAKTSPYEFYQYWVNTADADVLRYLRLFTPIAGGELDALEASVREKPGERQAQQRLAEHLTGLVHGNDAVARAKAAAEIFFGGSMEHVDSDTLLQVFHDVPATELAGSELASLSVTDLLVRTGVAASKGAARRAIEGGGIYINNARAGDPAESITSGMFVDNRVLVLRSGKKSYHLVRLS